MEEETTEEELTSTISLNPATLTTGNENYMVPEKFAQLQRVAKLFTKSDLTPKHLRDNPANVIICLQSAILLNVDPLMHMQNTYIVHGKPGIEGKYAIALINTRGGYATDLNFRYEGEGDNKSCTAYLTDKNEDLREVTINKALVIAEGWNKNKTNKNGSVTISKWNTMEDQMFAYRAASFFARLHCPHVLMGLQTVEEIEDVHNKPFDTPKDITPEPTKEPVRLTGLLTDEEMATLDDDPLADPTEDATQDALKDVLDKPFPNPYIHLIPEGLSQEAKEFCTDVCEVAIQGRSALMVHLLSHDDALMGLPSDEDVTAVEEFIEVIKNMVIL